MLSNLSDFEKIGGFLAYIPGVSTVFGVVKSLIYYEKSVEQDEAVVYTAHQSDAIASQRFRTSQETLSCYNSLWKISLAQVVPFINIIAAIYETRVLVQLSKLKNPNKLLMITEFDHQIENFELELEKEFKPKKISEINKIFQDGTKARPDRLALCEDVIYWGNVAENKTTTEEKLFLLQLIYYLSIRIDNKNQTEQLQRIKYDLFDYLLKAFKECLVEVVKSSKNDLINHRIIVNALSNPIDLNIQGQPFFQFQEEFSQKAGSRLESLEFKCHATDAVKFLNKLMIIYHHSIRYGFCDLNETHHLKEQLEIHLKFYIDLKKSLENAFKLQTSMLHQDNLTFLKARVPLYYNYNEHRIFMENRQKFLGDFKKNPERYPVILLNAKTGQQITVNDQKEFIKLKRIYRTQKSLVHEQMMRCMPSEYPVFMPNFLSLTGEPLIEIDGSDQFARLISTYVLYFEKGDEVLTKLNDLIMNKAKLILSLNPKKSQ